MSGGVSGGVSYRVAVFVDHGRSPHDLVCEAQLSSQALARDFAVTMLLDIHLSPERAGSGLFWCELSPHPRDTEVTGPAPGGSRCGVDSGQQSAPDADRAVDAVYLDAASGELTWDLTGSAQRWRSASAKP